MMAASKVAALVVLVAAVLVATSASAVHAASNGSVELVNTCNIDAIIVSSNKLVNILVKAGQEVGIDFTPLQGVIGPVYLSVGAVFYVIPQGVLNGIFNPTGTLVRLDIVCNSVECGQDRLAIRPYVQFIPGGAPQPLAVVCLDVVIHAP